MKINERIALAACILFIAILVTLGASQEVAQQLIDIHNLRGGERFMASLGLSVSVFVITVMCGFMSFAFWLIFYGQDWGE